MQTKNLKLVPKTLEDVHAMIDAMTPSEKAELSADWLALLRASTAADPWTYGFSLVLRDGDTVIGHGGFKGPPWADGVASGRVLIKCGFRRIGEVIDPEDGLVWRWEKEG